MNERIEKLRAELKHAEMDTYGAQANMVLGAATPGSCGPERYSPAWVSEVVRHHQPGPDAILKIGNVRIATEAFIRSLIENCPDSADRASAIRNAREAMMSGNASIVLNGLV